MKFHNQFCTFRFITLAFWNLFKEPHFAFYKSCFVFFSSLLLQVGFFLLYNDNHQLYVIKTWSFTVKILISYHFYSPYFCNKALYFRNEFTPFRLSIFCRSDMTWFPICWKKGKQELILSLINVLLLLLFFYS